MSSISGTFDTHVSPFFCVLHDLRSSIYTLTSCTPRNVTDYLDNNAPARRLYSWLRQTAGRMPCFIIAATDSKKHGFQRRNKGLTHCKWSLASCKLGFQQACIVMWRFATVAYWIGLYSPVLNSLHLSPKNDCKDVHNSCK